MMTPGQFNPMMYHAPVGTPGRGSFPAIRELLDRYRMDKMASRKPITAPVGTPTSGANTYLGRGPQVHQMFPRVGGPAPSPPQSPFGGATPQFRPPPSPMTWHQPMVLPATGIGGPASTSDTRWNDRTRDFLRQSSGIDEFLRGVRNLGAY